MSDSRKNAAYCQYGEGGKHAGLFAPAVRAIGRSRCPHPETQARIGTGSHLQTCSACLLMKADSSDPGHPLRTLSHILAH